MTLFVTVPCESILDSNVSDKSSAINILILCYRNSYAKSFLDEQYLQKASVELWIIHPSPDLDLEY